jgi:hypothetical protein
VNYTSLACPCSSSYIYFPSIYIPNTVNVCLRCCSQWSDTMTLNCSLEQTYCSPPRYDYGTTPRGKTEEISRKTCPSATLSTINLTWTDLGLNSGLCSDRLATNHLSHGMAIFMLPHLNFQMPSSNGSLVIAFKLKTKEMFAQLQYCFTFYRTADLALVNTFTAILPRRFKCHAPVTFIVWMCLRWTEKPKHLGNIGNNLMKC